jgi:heat-inducible transcriptional repressor
VLRAIIGDYVATREPVGSKRLVERYQFGVSAATIRNDMAALEEADLIVAPHTSSGRVPTDKGYRLFVDHLADVRPLTQAQKRAIEQFMEGAIDPEELLTRSVRSLAQLTGSVAIGHLPSLLEARIHRIELVALSPRRLLVVLITDSGRV